MRLSYKKKLKKSNIQKSRDFNFSTGSERFFYDFEKMNFSFLFDLSKNLQKPIKSDVSDTNGPQKRVCRVENILIDPGETDFRCTVTNFMKKYIFLSHNSCTEAAISWNDKKIKNYDILMLKLPFLAQQLHRSVKKAWKSIKKSMKIK